ncbi:MAG: hypothetical protein QG657_112, partial [Acidobacteriota bacterium]|nr:hypothetical protein [Acidobacteriota bacterium]
VVKNIANGTGPVLNPGDNHFPVTSPLWVFLSAFLTKIFSFIDLVLLTKIVSTICLGIASFLAFLLLRRHIGSWAVLTPLPILFNYITVTTVGGEIALVYLSLFAVLWAYYLKRNFILTGLTAAAAYLARPELILILPVLALHYVLLWKKENKTFRILLSDWGKLAIVFLVIVSIWHVYYAIQFHSIFPNTLKTKVIQGKCGMWPLYYSWGRPLTMEMLAGKYLLAIPLIFGLLYFRKISLALLMYTTLHYYAYKLLTAPYYHWYYYDFFLLVPMFTMFGLIALVLVPMKFLKILRERRKPGFKFPLGFEIPVALFILFLAVASIFITTKINNLSTYKNDSRYHSYKKITDAMRPKIKKGDVLLAPEIGILGYYLEDVIIRDLCGIASPGVTTANINDLDYFVKIYSPKFIFFPAFMKQKEPVRYFLDQQGKRVTYKLEYPQTDLSNPTDCIFSLCIM